VPLSSACAKLKPMLLNRRHIVILNKSDMLRSDEKQRWRDYFASRCATTSFSPHPYTSKKLKRAHAKEKLHPRSRPRF